jgi:glycosyltransferase involved in cell wall biosynthesis
MRILHVVPTYLPATRYGGPIYAIHGLCKSLVAAGAHVSVFTTNVDGASVSNVKLNSHVDMDGVEVTYFASPYLRRLYYSPDMKLALKKQIGRFDLVHGHSIYLWPTTLAARICYNTHTPYVLSPRGMLVEELIAKKNQILKSVWIRFVERKNISKASSIHFTSLTEANAASQLNLNIRTSFIIPNGIDIHDVDNFKKTKLLDTKKNNEMPLILYLGRINWKKGLDRLIKSMTLVKRGKLVIAGNDEENYTQQLKNLVRQYGLNDRVAFKGPRYGEDKYFLLSGADVFVLPSYSENFGNTVLESMALGCPVVVTPQVGLASKVEQTHAGLVVDGQPESIAEGINRLLDDQPTALKMGENGSRAARNEFSWTFVACQVFKKYQSVIRDNKTNDSRK